jgi:deoxyribonuclease (pyrimidine dimer)
MNLRRNFYEQSKKRMTRINCVPVEELTDKHLGAEYRELPRLFGQIQKAIERGELPNDPRNPTEYKLGKGHTRFFYDKVYWLSRRYAQLVDECKRRGRVVNHPRIPMIAYQFTNDWWKDWIPTPEAMELNRQRIQERLNGK